MAQKCSTAPLTVHLAKMLKISMGKSRLHTRRKELYVPYESELDGLSKLHDQNAWRPICKHLKKLLWTPSEALRIRWIDIDEKTKLSDINSR